MEDQNEDESPKKSTLWQVGTAAHMRQQLTRVETVPSACDLTQNRSQAVCVFR